MDITNFAKHISADDVNDTQNDHDNRIIESHDFVVSASTLFNWISSNSICAIKCVI